MQATGRELGQEPDESEVGLLSDSTDKVGEEAKQGELEGANQETEATPSEVCDSGQQVKRSGRSRASAVVDMKNLREGVDYGDNSPSHKRKETEPRLRRRGSMFGGSCLVSSREHQQMTVWLRILISAPSVACC